MMWIIVPVVLLIYMSYTWYYNRGLPPGPWGIPIFGYAPFLGDYACESEAKIAQRYGDIVSVNVGKPLIYLNSLPLIQKAFVALSEKFSYRPKDGILEVTNPKRLGIASAYGPQWQEQRRFTLRTLHDFGVGKPVMEDIIVDEAQFLCEKLRQCKQPACPISTIYKAVSNVVCHLLLGHRPGYDDPEFDRYIEAVSENMKAGTLKRLFIPGWLLRLRIVRYMFGANKLLGYRNTVIRYISSNIEKRHTEFNENTEALNFIDAFLLEKLRLDTIGETHSFSMEQLDRVVYELFMGGVDTTSGSLCWGVLLLSMHPLVQARFQEEIDITIGQRRPSMKDLRSMPFVEAVISEILRFQPIGTTTLPHSTIADEYLDGYRIPANSYVFASIWAVHRDARLWNKPNEFAPADNFLDGNGKVVNQEKLLSFSMGVRECPGKSLARVELFIFLTVLMQQFKFSIDIANQQFSEKELLRGEKGSGTRPPPPFLITWDNR